MDQIKRILGFILLIFIVSKLFSQPWWHKQPPSSSSDKYCYISVLVPAGGDVLELALPKAASCAGFTYDKGDAFSRVGTNGVRIKDKVIKFRRADSKDAGYGKEYVLMMFSTRAMKEKKRLPRPRRHLPLSFVLSTAIPGGGQFYKKESGKAWIFFSTAAALGGAAYYFDKQRLLKIDAYEKAGTFSERESLIEEIKSNQDYRNLAVVAFGTIYALNIIDAFASKGRRYACNYKKKVNWNVAYSPVSNSPIASLQFNLGAFPWVNRSATW